jgi:hypothetical protein
VGFSDDYDLSMIASVFIVGVIILAASVGGIYFLFFLAHENAIGDYRDDCTTNPRLRYLENCTTRDDCIYRCMERLYDDSKT